MAGWDVEEVAGAFLVRAPPEPMWVGIETGLSSDEETLVRVFEMSLGYRIQTMKKTTGAPHLKGMWWSEISPAIGASNREEALQFMTQFLRG